MNTPNVHPDQKKRAIRNGFFFSRLLWELMKGLPDMQRLSVYDALTSYAIDGKEPVLSGIGEIVFSAIRKKIEFPTLPVESPEEQSYDEAYNKFMNWIQENASFCANNKNFPHQITPGELERLKEKYKPEQIAHVILQIENRKDLRKKYSNLYLTVLNWAKREYGR